MQVPTCGPPMASGSLRLPLSRPSSKHSAAILASRSGLIPSCTRQAGSASLASSSRARMRPTASTTPTRSGVAAMNLTGSIRHCRDRRSQDRHRRDRYRQDQRRQDQRRQDQHFLRRLGQIPAGWGRPSFDRRNSGRRGSGRDHMGPCGCALSHSVARDRLEREIQSFSTLPGPGRAVLRAFVRQRI
jgi:hypothetical protein